ncbi:hypothetical protein [Tellurirhabdus rosea]|uniref:hypothetical protein n=1 Tax=Tellurirhabdus rosea TaxID=2674997 RepID=UPI00225A189A|nr:hypothetical protein [Tellurirhabdus rosea]
MAMQDNYWRQLYGLEARIEANLTRVLNATGLTHLLLADQFTEDGLLELTDYGSDEALCDFMESLRRDAANQWRLKTYYGRELPVSELVVQDKLKLLTLLSQGLYSPAIKPPGNLAELRPLRSLMRAIEWNFPTEDVRLKRLFSYLSRN